MTYLDAYALIALIGAEPAADEVEGLVRGGDCRVSIVNLAEAVDVVQRVHGLATAEVRSVLEPLFIDDIRLEWAAAIHAWSAGELRGRHYRRRDRPVSLADCFLVAHAQIDSDAVATSDRSLANMARGEGIPVVALPDRAGTRP